MISNKDINLGFLDNPEWTESDGYGNECFPSCKLTEKAPKEYRKEHAKYLIWILIESRKFIPVNDIDDIDDFYEFLNRISGKDWTDHIFTVKELLSFLPEYDISLTIARPLKNMKLLSYNPEDDEFFVGVNKKDFDKIVSNFNFEDEKIQENIKYVKEETKRKYLNKSYVYLIYHTYGIKQFPYAGFIVSRNLDKIEPSVLHHPFHHLWNAYSPWRKIEVRDISCLDELKDIHIECE